MLSVAVVSPVKGWQQSGGFYEDSHSLTLGFEEKTG